MKILTVMTPSIEKIKKGARPKKLTFRSEAHQGGLSDRKSIIATTVFIPNYKTNQSFSTMVYVT